MKVFTIFRPYEFTNTYLISKERSREAILVDPGSFDLSMLNLIEKNRLYISHVLLSHSHSNHTRGIPTLMKIYNARIYAMKPVIHGYRTELIEKETVLHIAGLKVTAIPIPGHSDDSLIFKLENMLFTGDTIKAGYTGETPGLKEQHAMTALIRKKIFRLSGEYLIFPGHGAPTTLAAEKRSNLLLRK